MGFCERLERGQFSLTIVFLFSHFDEFLCKGDTMLDWGPDPEPEQGEHPYDPNNPDLVAPAMGTTTKVHSAHIFDGHKLQAPLFGGCELPAHIFDG